MINEWSDNEGGLSTADIVLATNTMVMRSAHLFPIPTEYIYERDSSLYPGFHAY